MAKNQEKLQKELEELRLQNYLLKEELTITQSALLYLENENRKMRKQLEKSKKSEKLMDRFKKWFKSVF
uniref:Transposase n=1 Tax=Caenorhabditis tropicalis TaxID=1561998 RepID=A0A1I7TPM9_9PELO